MPREDQNTFSLAADMLHAETKTGLTREEFREVARKNPESWLGMWVWRVKAKLDQAAFVATERDSTADAVASIAFHDFVGDTPRRLAT